MYKTHKKLQRAAAVLLSLCLVVTMGGFSGIFSSDAYAAAQPTDTETRIADPNTMESYVGELLSDSLGSRNAGRIWSDKSVVAHGEGAGADALKLSMELDGYDEASVDFNADFLHVYSVLASSQIINEYPPSPIDLVLVLDVSSSMDQSTEPAEGTIWKEIYNDLVEYFGTPAGRAKLTDFESYYNSHTDKYTSIEDAAAKRAFDHTRFLNLIYSADNVIKKLMDNNPQNRVSVVVYDRRATVIMPLAHYEANENPLPLTVAPGKEEEGPDREFVYDTQYIRDDARYEVGSIINEHLKDYNFSYISPYFNGHAASGSHPTEYVDMNVMRVVASPVEDVDRTDMNILNEGDSSKRIAGTNTDAGIAAGMLQLANAKETTYSDVLSTGAEATVPRIPAMVVMTDGGSNTVPDGPWYDPQYELPVQRSDHENDWSSVVVTQTVLTSAYLKSAVENNYSAYGDDFSVYTVGVDLRDDTDDWVPARLYPMMNPAKYFLPEEEVPDKVPNPSAEGGSIELDSKTRQLIGQAYERWSTWQESESSQSTQTFPVAEQGSTMHARFQQTEDSNSDLVYESNIYAIPFENDGVNAASADMLEKTLNIAGKDYTFNYNKAWHGWSGDDDSVNPDRTVPEFPEEITGTATFWSFNEAKTAGESAGEDSAAKFTRSRIVTGEDGAKREVAAVTQEEMRSNVNYVTDFYNVSSADLDSIFDKILGIIIGKVFVPVSGDNDAGVGDSITYQDPIGQYMEVKSQAINAKTDADESGKGTYDMAMLLFGEMHGLLQSAVYDYQWNDKYIETHPDAGEKNKTPFPEGWYKGDAEEATGAFELGADGKLDYTRPKSLPDGLGSPQAAWEAGWVYRINFTTCAKYVPILSQVASPEAMSKQQQNTVYTIYRFAGDLDSRNELRINPIYGTEVPETVLEEYLSECDTDEATGRITGYPDGNEAYADSPGVYRLSDIRVWTEDTGDFVDTDGALSPEKAGYDLSLYANIPTAAVPTQVAEITLGRDGPVSYKTNLNEKTQSTPMRIFYAVGLAEELINRDAEGNQLNVNVAGLSEEYRETHTDSNNNIYFISNYYSGTTYEGYGVTGRTEAPVIGDPAVSFSPSGDNRYYIYQKPLPLYKHAYRVVDDKSSSGLAAVDDIDNWSDPTKSNSRTTWENYNGRQSGADWIGGEYMGTYDSPEAYAKAKADMKGNVITDSRGRSYEYKVGSIVFFEQSLITEKNVAGNTSGSGTVAGFNSDDYYFMLIDYYLPQAGVGEDIYGEPVEGTSKARLVQYAVCRRGGEFGSGLGAEGIETGDMVCWHDMSGRTDLTADFLPAATNDGTRGVPDVKKLTLAEEELEDYLESIGITDAETLQKQKAYWLDFRKKLLLLLDGDGDGSISATEYEAAGFSWALSAKPGGLRTGNMYRNMYAKTENPTATAGSRFVPTVSEKSGMGDDSVIDVYLGNNGRLSVANQTLLATKRLTTPEGYELTDVQNGKEFTFEAYIQGLTGVQKAVSVVYDPYSKSWEREIATIDVLTDNSNLLLDTGKSRALFERTESRDESGETVYLARQVVSAKDRNGTEILYYANDDGTPGSEVCDKSIADLYNLYLPLNDASEATAEGSNLTRRIYDNPKNDEHMELEESGVTIYYPADEDEPQDGGALKNYQKATAARPAGTKVYWALNAELIPTAEIDAAERGEDAAPWQHETTSEEERHEHAKLSYFTLMQEYPQSDTSEINLVTPYSTRSTFVTRDVDFGSDGRGLAQFTLKSDEGLLFTGLASNRNYSFTEKLSAGDKAEGYDFDSLLHAEGAGSGARKTYTKDDFAAADTYAVSGTTGNYEEQAHYRNSYEYGNISITKTLKAAEGTTLTDKDRGREFEFTLKLTDEASASALKGVFRYTITEQPEGGTGEAPVVRSGRLLPADYAEPQKDDITAQSDGSYKFTLKGGQTIKVNDVAVGSGYSYTIAEESAAGYDTEAYLNGAAGSGSEVRGRVDSIDEEPVSAEFVNTKKKAAPAEAGFELTKTVKDDSVEKSYVMGEDAFSFTVTPQAANPAGDPIRKQAGWSDEAGCLTVTSGTATDAVSATAEILPKDAQFSEPGVYRYTVREVVPGKTAPGVSYDGTVYTVTVTVEEDYGAGGDDYQGKLKAALTVTGGAGDDLAFTNGFDPNRISLLLKAHKTLTNQRGEELSFRAGDYSFLLKGISMDSKPEPGQEAPDGVPMPDSDAASVSEDGYAVFGQIEYAVPGTYVYEISEKNEGLPGVTYDDTVYTAEVTVTRDEATGALEAEVSYKAKDGDDGSSEEAAFANTVVTGGLKVSKTVTGDGGDRSKSFGFTVTILGADGRTLEYIDGSYGEMSFVKGVATFTLRHGDSLTADNLPEGVTYVVKETAENEDGYKTSYTGDTGAIGGGTVAEAAVVNDRDKPEEAGPGETPDEPEKSYKKVPKTGDERNANVWLTVMAFSLAGFAALAVSAHKTAPETYGTRRRRRY